MKVKRGLQSQVLKRLHKRTSTSLGNAALRTVSSAGCGGAREHWHLKEDIHNTLEVRIWDRYARSGLGECMSSHSSKDVIIEPPSLATIEVLSERITPMTLRTDLGFTALLGGFETAARSIRSKCPWGRVTTMVQVRHS